MRPVAPKTYRLPGLTVTTAPAPALPVPTRELSALDALASFVKAIRSAWSDLREAVLMAVRAIAIARGGRQQGRSGSRVVGSDVINTHAGTLAEELAALREVVVDGDVRGRDALKREEESGHRLPQGVELGTDRHDLTIGEAPLGCPLRHHDSLLKLKPLFDLVKDIAELSHDSSSVGGDGATGGDPAPSPVDGDTDPTEEALAATARGASSIEEGGR